jgi:WhiB family transcriptional regulator, redox-sensing transcriptional regulator
VNVDSRSSTHQAALPAASHHSSGEPAGRAQPDRLPGLGLAALDAKFATPPSVPVTTPQSTPLTRLAERWSWQLSARCRMEDPSVFFHPDGERGRPRQRRQDKARAICAQCPVAVQCRQHAVTYDEQFGTWGGLSEDDRRRVPPSR